MVVKVTVVVGGDVVVGGGGDGGGGGDVIYVNPMEIRHLFQYFVCVREWRGFPCCRDIYIRKESQP